MGGSSTPASGVSYAQAAGIIVTTPPSGALATALGIPTDVLSLLWGAITSPIQAVVNAKTGNVSVAQAQGLVQQETATLQQAGLTAEAAAAQANQDVLATTGVDPTAIDWTDPELWVLIAIVGLILVAAANAFFTGVGEGLA